MTEAQIVELFEQAKAEAPPEIRKLMKRQDGLVNFLVGQVLRQHKTADPMAVREAVIRKLNAGGEG